MRSKKPVRICYRCGLDKPSTKQCGRMFWCKDCREELTRMSAHPGSEAQYVPDDERPHKKVLVNHVDAVLEEHINKEK
jgi:predicted amidophosphoribosyltransferase